MSNTEQLNQLLEDKDNSFREYQRQTNKQLRVYNIFVVVLAVFCVFFIYQGLKANNAIDGILQGHEKQLYQLNESYQLQLDCLQDTYGFNEDECL